MAPKSNAPATSEKGTITVRTPFEQMLRAMSFDAQADDGQYNGEDINEILAAETEDEMWDADERPPLNFQHLAGCELQVNQISVRYSRDGNDILTPFVYADAQGKQKKMYLMVTCERISDAGEKPLIRLPKVGEEFIANTSARFIVAKLWWALTKGRIDPEKGQSFRCVVKEIDLGGGQAVLKLRPMPNHAVQSTLA